MTDEYLTIETPSEGYYTERRSKFLSFAHPVSDVSEVKSLVAEYRRKYFDARHVCYAFMLGAERSDYRAVDDGEPSSTAGKPILGQINSRMLTNVLVVVVRYYGGVNLGTSGLTVAYRTAASEALDNASIVNRQVEEIVTFSFSYPQMNAVMRIVRDAGARIVSQTFDNTCEIRLAIRRGLANELQRRLTASSML